MTSAVSISENGLEPSIFVPSVEQRIAAFLDGDTQGEDLLHEIYDHVLDEPIPAGMLALLRR